MGILKIKTTSSPSPFAPISFCTIQWLLSEPRIHEKCTTSNHISSELYHTLFSCTHTLHLSFFLFILYNYVIHFSYSYSNSPHEFSSHHYFTCSSHLMLSPILSSLFLGLLLCLHLPYPSIALSTPFLTSVHDLLILTSHNLPSHLIIFS